MATIYFTQVNKKAGDTIKQIILLLLVCYIPTRGQEILFNSGKQINTSPSSLTASLVNSYSVTAEANERFNTLFQSTTQTSETSVTLPTAVSSYSLLVTGSLSTSSTADQKLAYLVSFINWHNEIPRKLISLQHKADSLQTLHIFTDNQTKKEFSDTLMTFRETINTSSYVADNITSLYDTSYTFEKRQIILNDLARQHAKLILLIERSNIINNDFQKISLSIIEKDLRIKSLKRQLSLLEQEVISIPLASITSVTALTGSIISNISTNVPRITKSSDSLSRNYNTLSTEINHDQSIYLKVKKDFDNLNKEYNTWAKAFDTYRGSNFKAAGKSVVESEFGALPSVSQLLGDVRAPTLN
ncbi:hypothetical protein LC612_43850, partial [Nostoc sp. CHAB 5834]|nr:hypothetical protein [Nostoc sp. CHAB 5834]